MNRNTFLVMVFSALMIAYVAVFMLIGRIDKMNRRVDSIMNEIDTLNTQLDANKLKLEELELNNSQLTDALEKEHLQDEQTTDNVQAQQQNVQIQQSAQPVLQKQSTSSLGTTKVQAANLTTNTDYYNTTTDITSQLKDCPMCGRHEISITSKNGKTTVACRHCYTKVDFDESVDDFSDKKIIEIWNALRITPLLSK